MMIDSGKLIEARFDGETLRVSFSKYQKRVESLLAEVKQYAEQFSLSMDAGIVSNYDLRITSFEEKLVTPMFRASAENGITGLDNIAKNIADTFTRLKNDPNTASELVLFVATDDHPAANVSISRLAKVQELIARPGPGGPVAPADARTNGYYDNLPRDGLSSIVASFNQVLASYLTSFVDNAGNKIYQGLISSFANGVAGQAVSSPNLAIDDRTPVVLRAVETALNNGGIYICRSLAYVLQRLTRDVNDHTQSSYYLINAMTDVPLYMKEKMRAHLPYYSKLFELIIQKCDFVKQSIQNGKITASADVVMALDAVSDGAYTLSAAAADVLRELGDRPIYLATSEGSIETYKSRYGRLPIMPLSHLAYFLRSAKGNDPDPDIITRARVDRTDHGAVAAANVAIDDAAAAGNWKLYPSSVNGSAEFKIQYGVRGLLASRGSLTYVEAPGLKTIIESYNSTAPAREQIDETRYLAFGQNVLDFVRYFVESREFKGAIFPAAELASRGVATLLAGDQTLYSLNNSVKEFQIISTVESMNSVDELKKITSTLDSLSRGPANMAPHGALYDGNSSSLDGYREVIVPIDTESETYLLNDLRRRYNNGTSVMKDMVRDALVAAELLTLPDGFDPRRNEAIDRYGAREDAANIARYEAARDQRLGELEREGKNHVEIRRILDNEFNGMRDQIEPNVRTILRMRAMVDELNADLRGRTLGTALSETLIDKVNTLNAALTAMVPRAGVRVGYMGGPGRGDPRVAERVDNLVTLNIVPVNVHALMRDVPLVNLYNFEYTFEQMAAANYGGDASSYQGPSAYGIRTTRNLFTKLLIDPYYNVDKAPHVTALKDRMFRGDNDTGMGRPKFLSDQIYSKCLLRSVFTRGADGYEYAPLAQGPLARVMQVTNTDPLYYINPADPTRFVMVPLDPDRLAAVHAVGDARFNTRIIRNLVFVTDVVRALDLRIRRELSDKRSVIVESAAAFTPGMYEYGNDPFAPSESFGSLTPSGFARFASDDK